MGRRPPWRLERPARDHASTPPWRAIAPSPQTSGRHLEVVDMTGLRTCSRMIEGCSANRPAVSTAQRTEGNSRLAPSAARVR